MTEEARPSNKEEALNSDLREEVLKYLKQTTKEPQPQFPTEYATLMYVALGTLRLLHEGTTNYNMWAIQNNREPRGLDYFFALQGIVELLEALAPQMQELGEPLIVRGTGGFTL